MIGAFVVVRFDVLVGRHEIEIVNRIEMAFDVFQALGRTFMVVKGHAGADDIEDRAAPMRERALNQR